MTDDSARIGAVAEAIWRADPLRMGDPNTWTGKYDQFEYLHMAQAAIDALQLTPEQERRKKCVCRHPEVDHDSYGNGHCEANMVTRHTPCPCTGFVAQNRHRLVSPWVRSDA